MVHTNITSEPQRFSENSQLANSNKPVCGGLVQLDHQLFIFKMIHVNLMLPMELPLISGTTTIVVDNRQSELNLNAGSITNTKVWSQTCYIHRGN